jgi:dinuclear metal center YbgI/SA1388 family protein
LLQTSSFKDYGPNGLQVEGRDEVLRLVSGVTASRALIDAAIGAEADALLVHHGLFWRGHDGRVTGWLKQRLQRLLAHDISLYAYHLPLDAHAEFGNNAQLGVRLGVAADARFGEQSLGFIGTPAKPTRMAELTDRVRRLSGRTPTCIEGDGRPLTRLAWCSGGAQSYFEAAIEAGADVFVTGEISEPQAHLARETGVAFIAFGHHASERYGAPALGEHLATQFGIDHRYIEIDNPA